MEDNRLLAQIINEGIRIGTIQTLKQLGLLSEVISVSQAEKIYGKRLIKEWREKRLISLYPSNNKDRGRFYLKRSELETASSMMIINKIPDNIFQTLKNKTI